MDENNENKSVNEADSAEKISTEIAIVDEQAIRDRIYVVRGVKVMLDFELAEIYGYTTRAFNQQVKNNIQKFDDDFRFQLTREEIEELSRSKNLTSIQTKGIKGGRAYLPWAFTESGIYMLMTVLKGDLATRQSKALIRTFRAMKDYIVDNNDLLRQHELLQLSLHISDTNDKLAETNEQLVETDRKLDETANTVHIIREELVEQESRFSDVFKELDNTVKKSEISQILLDFAKPSVQKNLLLLNGQPLKADEAYIDIYSQAEKSIHIIDDYISIKTLRLMQNVKNGVKVTVLSDNVGHNLHMSDYNDFNTEFPYIEIDFIKTEKKVHDRYIILDYETDNERIFSCGSSSKDSGMKMTTITEATDEFFITMFNGALKKLLSNPELELKP